MAGSAGVGAEEDLRDILRELQLDHLAGVDVAAPLDAPDEAFGVGRRVDQLADELVVRLVVEEGLVEPAADLLAAAVDVARAGVIVAEHVVPEGEPVLGERAVLVQKLVDELNAAVGRLVAQERVDLSAGVGSRPMRSR
ncbi:MAG: hypothetical protein U0793_23710 [Gemmataceae bacterium]